MFLIAIFTVNASFALTVPKLFGKVNLELGMSALLGIAPMGAGLQLPDSTCWPFVMGKFVVRQKLMKLLEEVREADWPSTGTWLPSCAKAEAITLGSSVRDVCGSVVALLVAPVVLPPVVAALVPVFANPPPLLLLEPALLDPLLLLVEPVLPFDPPLDEDCDPEPELPLDPFPVFALALPFEPPLDEDCDPEPELPLDPVPVLLFALVAAALAPVTVTVWYTMLFISQVAAMSAKDVVAAATTVTVWVTTLLTSQVASSAAALEVVAAVVALATELVVGLALLAECAW